MPRTFRHLTKAEISDIIMSFNGGEMQASIAKRLGIDHSTVNYHVGKYQASYPEDGTLYSHVKVEVRRDCIHPSGRCSLCNEWWDEIRRKERDEIERLNIELARAKELLRVAGFVE